MKLEFKLEKDIGILKIIERLDASNAGELKLKFKNYLSETSRFIFDLGELELVDSTGLGAIISCLKSVADTKGDVKICSLNHKTKMLFEITRADRIFDIFNDVESAVKSYS